MATSPAAAPDLRALGLLVAVADAGGIGAAARSLGISQPSASDGVRALERRLGLTLVRRGRTGSELTDAGRIVVELARRVLAATSDLTDAARTLRGEAATQLTVCASLTVAEHLVPQWLVRMAHEAPEISIAVRMANSADVAEQVRSGAVALGFVEGASAPHGLRSTTICTDELALLVRATHPWACSSAGSPRTASGPPPPSRSPRPRPSSPRRCPASPRPSSPGSPCRPSSRRVAWCRCRWPTRTRPTIAAVRCAAASAPSGADRRRPALRRHGCSR